MKRNKAVFLDKDGTLIEDVAYNVSPEKIKLYPEVPGALQELKSQGFKLVVVSNQPGIAHGFFGEDALKAMKERLQQLLSAHDVMLDGFYFCPHHPEGKMTGYAIECICRKPRPGLLLQAATEMNIDLSVSWMIGDILNDVEAGNRAGCKTILIDNGNETEWAVSPERIPAHIVKHMNEAAGKITGR